jgi:hypothetical protein
VNSSETVRCSPWTQATDPDPCGTAGEYDTILAIEVPGPWPSDVGEISELWSGFDPSVRALAVLPDGVDRRGMMITAWGRALGGSFVGTDYTLAAGASYSTEIAAIATGKPTSNVVATPAPNEILMCGHGQRDRCCGNFGVRLQTQLSSRLEGIRVRRCSHLGGHRFSPTAITFPDGRWWAYLDSGLVDRIIAADIDAVLLASHYRGRGGLGAHAQMVERQLFTEHGAAWKHVAISSVTTIADPENPEAVLVSLEYTGHRTTARVLPGRDAPQVKCGSVGAVITKVATELRVDWLRTTKL